MTKIAKWDGLPRNPDQQGWHFLRQKGRNGKPRPMEWVPNHRVFGATWKDGEGGHISSFSATKFYHYVEPCKLPTGTQE